MAREILKRAALPHDEVDIILVHLIHNEVTPWVTWQVNLGDDSETYWGHYHRTLEEADAEFTERCANKHATEYTDSRPLRA